MSLVCKKSQISKYLLVGLTELGSKYRAANFATRIKMLLVALVIWVLAGPILKPLIIDMYSEYEKEKVQPVMGEIQEVQPEYIVNMEEVIASPELTFSDNDIITLPSPIVIEQVPVKKKVNNTKKIQEKPADSKPEFRITEVSKKLPENKGIEQITPFAPPYNIR